MNTEELAICVVALAGGIVLGFVAWTYISPMISAGAPSLTA
jgi:hypothetical protein